MAIAALQYVVLRSLREQNVLPQGATALELGESNMYGDVSVQEMENDIARLVTDDGKRASLIAELHEAMKLEQMAKLYCMAKVFYRGVLGCSSIEAVDPGTPGSEYKFDLNDPVAIDKQFDLVLNLGTGEHIFNVFQFYKTVHELTRPQGLMVHAAPMTGWFDHGFYNFQPTFFFDVARTNNYEVLAFVIGQLAPLKLIQIKDRDELVDLSASNNLPPNAMINIIMRQAQEPGPFVAPVQGFYAGQVSEKARQAWLTLR